MRSLEMIGGLVVISVSRNCLNKANEPLPFACMKKFSKKYLDNTLKTSDKNGIFDVVTLCSI